MDYTSVLREYRALKEALEPLTRSFEAEHGRKPTLADVEARGPEEQVLRYRRYLLLRDKVMGDTAGLRQTLSSAAPDRSIADLLFGPGAGKDKINRCAEVLPCRAWPTLGSADTCRPRVPEQGGPSGPNGQGGKGGAECRTGCCDPAAGGHGLSLQEGPQAARASRDPHSRPSL